MTPSTSARRAALAAALLAPLAGPAGAVEPQILSADQSVAGVARATAARKLDLSIGRSVIIDLPRDAKEVFVANPAIANAVVRSARKIFMIGVSNGVTSVFVMDGEGRQITSLEVNVGRDLSVLRQTLQTAIPTGRIDVRAAGDSILLTGTVASAGDAQQAVDIAKAFVGQTSSNSNIGGTTTGGVAVSSSTTGTVINALAIAGRDQVMLKVTVVEMARTALKQLGVNVGGNWNVLGEGGGPNSFTNPVTSFVGLGTGAKGSIGGAGADVSGQVAVGGATIGGSLKALERAGVSRVLAEPTLVAISGEQANFLAGGEIPYPVCAPGTGTTTAYVCAASFKNIGVQLSFTPVVLSENRISLRVQTEVNELDRDNSVQLYGTAVPGFRTRKTNTTVELPSGATMVTAGLVSSQSGQTISGTPALINLPILGALFRSRDFQRRDTELMIMVQPFIAKPMEAAQVKRPDDNWQDATDPQTALLGRLNKLYGVAGGAPGAAPKRASGRYGFITD